MTQKRLIITEVRRNLPSNLENVETWIQYSPTLRALVRDNENQDISGLLTPDTIQKIVTEITSNKESNANLQQLPAVLAGVSQDPFFITPYETELAKKYSSHEEIPLYANTLLSSVEGYAVIDPQTGALVLAPTQNSRIDSPDLSAPGYIGPITPEQLDSALLILEDEIQQEREAQGISHSTDTVTDDGGMGLYNMSVQDLVDIGVVSPNAVIDYFDISSDKLADYALDALRSGLIAAEIYDKIPAQLRSALHWYVLTHTEYWLEKLIGPKNFLTLKKIQKLLIYRYLISQWKTNFRYFIQNTITKASTIAGYLIASKVFGKKLSQLFGLGAIFSTKIGKTANDILNRTHKAVESGIKAQTAKQLDEAGKSVPNPPSPPAPPARKYAFFANIKSQPSNLSLRKVPPTQGFYDPNNVYPRVSHIGEPDTNRLARNQKIKNTIVGLKDDSRTTNIPIARNAGKPWSQPKSPYNAKYPYNHVQETESGHVIEYDDTPNNERMHWYHREGTFMEIDPNGTMVRKIVGDGYEILERDGNIYIGGRANVTVEGNCNIYVKNNVNLQVDGDLVADVHRSMKLNIAKNLDITVGDNINVKAKNATRIQGKTIDLKGTQKLSASADNVNVRANKVLRMSGNTMATLAAPSQKGQVMILSVLPAIVNGASVVLMPKPDPMGALALAQAGAAMPATPADVGGPPAVLSPKEPKFIPLTLEDKVDEWASALSTLAENADANKEEIKVLKKKGIDEGLVKQEDLDRPLTEGQKDTTAQPTAKPAKIASCSLIYSQMTFPSSYQLSKNITLGMLKGTDHLQAQHGLSVQDIVCNLRQLAENVIEPIFEIVGKNQIIISSTFRTPGQVTGSLKPAAGISFHEQGLAVDFCFKKQFTQYYDLAVNFKQAIQFDKLLLEYRLGNVAGTTTYKPWIHVQWQQQGINMANGRTGGQARLTALTFKNDSTYSTSLVNLLPGSTLSYA